MSVIFNKPSLSQDLEFSLQRRRNTTMAQYFEIFLVYTLLVLVASSYMKHFDGNTQLNVQLVENEYQALYDLYRSTNGWDWDYRESWNFTSGADPCNPPWVGLKCQEYSSSSGTNFHITSIEFYHCNMHGSLPDSLGTFSKNLHVQFCI